MTIMESSGNDAETFYDHHRTSLQSLKNSITVVILFSAKNVRV